MYIFSYVHIGRCVEKISILVLVLSHSLILNMEVFFALFKQKWMLDISASAIPVSPKPGDLSITNSNNQSEVIQLN